MMKAISIAIFMTLISGCAKEATKQDNLESFLECSDRVVKEWDPAIGESLVTKLNAECGKEN